ncbi:MAG: hypothetical protein ABIU05_17625, partial [Nitrospirales bacterium]
KLTHRFTAIGYKTGSGPAHKSKPYNTSYRDAATPKCTKIMQMGSNSPTGLSARLQRRAPVSTVLKPLDGKEAPVRS